MKNIGIVGSRRRNTVKDYQVIVKAFFKIYKSGDKIISGGCPKGADSFAENIAEVHHIPIKIFYADWKRLGKKAGFIRNTDIAEESNVLIACVASDRTGGTEDTIKKFLKNHPKSDLYLV